jgi:hypothetical protein
MAFTKSQLEALKNALLASNQPITAPIHREFAQKIIDELYDAQSRANLLSAIQNDSSLLTTDSVFVIRNGQGFLIPSSQVGGTGSLANLTDTVIIDPQDGEVIIYNSVTEKWENRVAGVVFNDFYVRHDIDNQGLDATQKSNATTNIGAQSILEKGQADGYASLDGTGRVPSSQLPSFVDDVLEFADLASFPETGESGKIYIALDTNKTYRWGGTTYVEISAGVVLGETETTAYRGDRGKIAYDYSQIGHLPLTGGTLASSGSTNTLDINHASGSGLALNITKAGNNEGLKVVKTSGSGLAASITGGVTLLDELNLTTKLADAHIASADTWNAKIGGTIATGQVAFGTADGVIGGDSGLTWNNTTKILSATNDAIFNGVNVGRGGGNVSSNTRVGSGALNANTTGNQNTAVGVDCLRFNTTGSNNTANGRLALRNNTTGNNNTASGYFTLFNNTTGNSNTANGTSALEKNTTGNDNTASGFNALFNNTTGNSNTANGYFALFNNTTGGSNIAFGFNSGRYIADGTTANTITNNSVFLGASTKALADNQTNQIVIGHNAIGLGSNSVVLGNDLITFTGLKGNVGVNTTTNAGFRLDVNGTARIVGATRIDNLAGTGTRMVVADANGVMSTQALGIAGSGTTNYLAKFTDGGTVGDSQVFDNGTNVGIGTDSPSDKLAIGNGSESINVRITGNNSGSSGGSAINVGILGTTNIAIGNKSAILGGSYDSTALFYWGNDGDLVFSDASERMRITSGGNLLINTDTDAGFRLDVNGTGRFTGNLNVDARIGVGVSPLHDIHISKAGQDTAIVTEVTSTNRAATNNSLSNVAGVSIAAFGSTYPESGGSRWAGRSGVYINTGKPNQTFNVWIGNKTIMNSLNTGWTAIGQNDPIAFFHVQGSAVVDGSMSANSYITTSDKRKKDIISQDGDLATYQFKGDDQIHYGYIAQDMEDLYPNQVSTDNNGMMSLNYIEILVKKVHDLEKEIQLLKNK